MLSHLYFSLSRRLRKVFGADPDSFLKRSKGVIHVGANIGQEREQYAMLGLPVVWFEPIPSVFKTLAANIAGLPDQRAVQALISDAEGADVTFNISGNNGEASSMLELKGVKEVWPGVEFVDKISLKSTTLPASLAREGIDATSYDTLIMDTQGAEMHVLRGAKPMLSAFRFVKAEASDFEAYEGCCQLRELDAFLVSMGFKQISKEPFYGKLGFGTCYDVVYERRA